MSRLTAAGALSLLALCCFVQHGAAVNVSASSTGVSIAWAPSQKCDDSPGGNCALCNEFALQCLICLPGYGFNSHKACQNCRMGGLRLCLSCDLAMRPPKCLKCLGAPTSDIPYGWANPGYPTFMDAQGSCQKCAKVNDPGCLSCNMAGTACNACNDGFVLTGGVCKPCADPNCKKCRTNGKCIECVENTRGPSYGLTAQKTCKQCKSVGCERCSKDWRKCERCIDGIASVGQRGFGSNGAGVCVRCKSSLCAKCQRDFRVCSQCAVDPLSLALPIKTPTGECKKCLIEGCAACSASGKTCAKCALGFIRLPSGQCEQLPKNCVTRNCLDCRGNKNVCRACAPQFYESSPNQCRRCINGCELCDSGNGICKKCNPNAGLVGTKCVRCATKNEEYSWCEQCDGDVKRCQRCWPANLFRPDRLTGGCVRYRLPDTFW